MLSVVGVVNPVVTGPLRVLQFLRGVQKLIEVIFERDAFSAGEATVGVSRLIGAQ
jgi:hypothetical protein